MPYSSGSQVLGAMTEEELNADRSVAVNCLRTGWLGFNCLWSGVYLHFTSVMGRRNWQISCQVVLKDKVS